jgi:sec-independent protein translocase protein TatA
MFFGLIGPLGVPELLLLLVIVVLIFGATRLPDIGKGLGKGISNFKKSVKGEGEDEPGAEDTKKS